MGGLSRRAYILNKIKKEEPKPILVLDAGAMLFPQPYLAPSLFSAKTVQADGVIEAMSKMGYDAFGLAPQDLSAGTKFLLKQPADVQLPWLSMNLVRKNDQKLLFAPYIIKTAGDLSVGILGLSGHQAGTQKQAPLIDYQAIDWEKQLKTVLAQIKDQADIVILLSSLSEQTNHQIAEKFSDIHLIIQSGQSTANKAPQLFGNTLICQIASRGKYVGRIDIDWQPSRTWKKSPSVQIKPIKDRLDRTNWQIGRLEKRYSPGTIEQNAQYKQLVKEERRLTAELTELTSHQPDSPEQFSSYKSSFIGLPVSLPENPEIREIVLRTKLATNTTNRRTLTKAQQEKTQANLQAFANLAGWKACQSCHIPQTEFWQRTNHAKAFQTLEKVNQQFNPECLICHVTLPTYDHDSVTRLNLLSGLKDEYKTIGCETCHGPAKNHTLQPDLHRPAKPNEQTCLACHTPERDDNFVFLEKLERIRCPASNH